MKWKPVMAHLIPLIGMVWMVALAGCRSQKVLTVSEVRENAQALDGQQIHVRGQAHVYTDPYVGLIGCPPAGTIENDVVVGRMFLLPDEDQSTASGGIAISESSLLCKGTHCGLSCAPFDPGDMSYCMAMRDDPHPPLIYEMVGTLRVNQAGGSTTLLLEDINLAQSRRLMAETWEAIPTATIEYWCP